MDDLNKKERDQKLAELQRKGLESSIEREAQSRNMPYINVSANPRAVSKDALSAVDFEDSKRAQLVPLELKHTNISLGLVEPSNAESKKVISELEEKGFTVTQVLISRPSLERALKEYKNVPKERSDIGDTIEISSGRTLPKTLEELRLKFENTVQTSTSDLLEILHGTALYLGASDIHLEPQESGGRVRLRIDGILEDVAIVSEEVYEHLMSRIKVISRIPLNIPTTAHDGRYSVVFSEGEAEVRVSILPSPNGQYVVLRLLNPNAISLKVDELGLEKDLWDLMEPELNRSNGIILTTGPTGSGKTTTLYAFLSYLHKPDVKIITLENPIEYHLEGISQTQIETEKGYGFSDGVRAALRHDPDIILVGEIRDSETAEAALHASLTGHLVFSTLHTNDAAGAIPRFLDLNAKAEILSSALRAIIAQRLVRKLCQDCKKRLEGKAYESALEKVTKELAAYPALAVDEGSRPELFEAVGCERCGSTGFKGRLGIFEILVVTPDLEELINRSPAHHDVLEYGLSHGFQSMYINGLRKVLAGLTTVDEIERVVDSH